MKAPLMPIRILLICVLMEFSVTGGLAATINWTNLSGGFWNVAENWNPQQVPGMADTVSITAKWNVYRHRRRWHYHRGSDFRRLNGEANLGGSVPIRLNHG